MTEYNGYFNLMSGKYFMIQVKDNKVRIFGVDSNGWPDTNKELSLYSYDDLKRNNYLLSDTDPRLIQRLNEFNEQDPLRYVNTAEKIAIDGNYRLFCFFDYQGVIQFKQIEVNYQEVKNSANNVEDKKDIDYKNIFEELDLHGMVKIANYDITKEGFDMCLRDPSILNTVNMNSELRQIYQDMISAHYQMQRTDNSGGNSGSKAKTKIKSGGHGGYTINLFAISLAGFTLGIISSLIIILIQKKF